MPAIINSGVSYIASQQAATQPVAITKFVLANIPNLDHTQPVNLNEAMPAPEHIVWQGNKTRDGYINPNAVVYSLMLGSNVGDFDFNWIGLVNDKGDLVAVNYVPVIEKRKTDGTTQGNNITRNFMIEFSDAQDSTGITVSAETWQIDFTARLKLIDEHERESNADIYGVQAFFFDGWKVTFDGSKHYATAGVGYVNGIRIEMPSTTEIATSAWPTNVWLDVSYQGDINGVDADVRVFTSTSAQNYYIDNTGQEHYLVRIASLAANGTVTDHRKVYDVTSSLIELIDRPATESKAGRAKIATSAQASAGTDHTTIITPKTLKERLGNYLGKTAKAVSAAIADKWTTARKITLDGDVAGSVSIDGSRDVTMNVTVADDSHYHTRDKIINFDESVQDVVGDMVSGNTESQISVNYQDSDGTLDFVLSQGPGSGLNADRVDGHEASAFLRADTTTVKTTGNLRFNDSIKLTLGSGNDVSHFWDGSNYVTDIYGGGDWYIRDGNSSHAARFQFDIDNGFLLAAKFIGALQGTADNSSKLGNVAASDFGRLSQSNTWTQSNAFRGDVLIGGSGAQFKQWLTLQGANDSSQRTGISMGESGKHGAAALHIYYTGDGYGHIGMGTMSDTAHASNRALQFHYQSPAITFLGLAHANQGVRLGAGKTLQFENTDWLYLTGAKGDYGSVSVFGERAGWAGYSISDRVVFMHNNADISGLYNDVNNAWLVKCIQQGSVSLYHDSIEKLTTHADGVRVHGKIYEDGTQLVNKYLGINAKAKDSDAVDGYSAEQLFRRIDNTNNYASTSNSMALQEFSNNLPSSLSGAYPYGGLVTLNDNNTRLQMYAPHVQDGKSALYLRTGWDNDIRAWERVLMLSDGDGRYLRSDISQALLHVLETRYGIHGGYGNNSGVGSDWGSTIWGMGTSYDGEGYGTSYTPGNMYGLAWLRDGHGSRSAYVGEGLHIFRAGSIRGGIGSEGIWTSGIFRGNGSGISDLNASNLTTGTIPYLRLPLSSSVTSTSTTEVATPSAVRSAYNLAASKAPLSTASKSSNGYWRCGSTGMIIQWGLTGGIGDTGYYTVTFPIAFPSECRSFTATMTGSGQSTAVTSSVGRTSGRIRHIKEGSSVTVPAYWIAIGY